MTRPQKTKVRLSVDCTPEERMYIKMLATKNNMTISEYLLSFPRQNMPKKQATPNAKTKKALQESRKGGGKSYESLDEFWNDMGMQP